MLHAHVKAGFEEVSCDWMHTITARVNGLPYPPAMAQQAARRPAVSGAHFAPAPCYQAALSPLSYSTPTSSARTIAATERQRAVNSDESPDTMAPRRR